MADLLTLATFENRTNRTLSGGEDAQAEGLITDASNLVIDIVDDSDITDDWTDANVPGAIVPVLVAMVRRGLDNPDGYERESIDGYSYGGAKGHGVYATRGERKTVRKAAGKSPAGTLDLEGYLPRSYADPSTSWLDGAL